MSKKRRPGTCSSPKTAGSQSVNLNARSLSIEKLDELNVNVGIHDVSVICVTETWFKDYMGSDSLNLHGFNLERKDRKMDELEALHVI